MVGSTLLQYEIKEMLGSGAMGTVYRAFDTRLEVYRALKFLQYDLTDRSNAMAQLLREARTQAKLNHPNIATLHDLGETDQYSFLVMEYVDGPPLDTFLEERKPSRDERFLILLQIAAALEAAHAQGILHRDIKPQNILVASDGTVKVTDFGLAKALGQTTLSLSGETKGTAPYMAPEIYRGENATEAADVWSFGILAFQVLTGRLPFQGQSFEEIALSILNEDAPPLPEEVESSLPGISAFLDYCLQKDSYKRIGDGGQLLESLLEVAENAQIQTSTSIPRTIPRSTAVRRGYRGLPVVAGLILAIAAATILATGSPSIRTELIDSSDLASGQFSPTWVEEGQSLALLGALGEAVIEYRRIPLGDEGIRKVPLPAGYEWSELRASPSGSLFALTGTYMNPGLYLYPTSGDTLLQVCDHSAFSPAWSSDGRMLLYTYLVEEPGLAVSRLTGCRLAVPPDGGIPERYECRTIECSGLPPPESELSLYNPVFIMGDSKIAFVVSRGARILGIWMVPAEGGESTQIGIGGLVPWMLQWDEFRRTLYFNTYDNQDIYAIRFNRQGEIRAPPRRLQIDSLFNDFTFSSQTGRLALMTAVTEQPIFRIPFPDSDVEAGVVAEGMLYSPAVSEDGRILYYSEVVPLKGLQLRQQDLTTGEVTRCLADDPTYTNEHAPAPEPGGGGILAILVSSMGQTDLFLYDLQNHRYALRVTNDEAVESEPAWAPDGTSIFYASRIRPRIAGRSDQIIRCRLDRTGNTISEVKKDTLLEHTTLGYPRISADGGYLLFQTGGDTLGILDLNMGTASYSPLGRYPVLTQSRQDALFLDGFVIKLWSGWAETGFRDPAITPIAHLPEQISRLGSSNPKMTAGPDAVYIPGIVQSVPELKIYLIRR